MSNHELTDAELRDLGIDPEHLDEVMQGFGLEREPTASAKAVPRDAKLNEIARLAQDMLALQSEIATLEETLKRRREALDAVQLGSLPEAMDAVGLAQFKLTDGTVVTVADFLKLNYIRERIDDIDMWLRAHGHGGILKREVSTSIPRGENSDDFAVKAAEALRQAGFEPEDVKSLNYQTLNKWGRDMRDGGNIIPDDIGLTVWEGRRATIKAVKNGDAE